MESLPIKLGNNESFDRLLRGEGGLETLPDYGDLQIITKDCGTTGGNGIAMLTFTVGFKGQRLRVQTVTTIRLLKFALAILNGRYDDNGRLREEIPK